MIDDGSICTIWKGYYFALFNSLDEIGIVVWFIDFMILIPSLTFFALDQPHDCYICLGKDPERIYSSF